MLKSEDEAWQLFEILSKNSLHHMSASIRDKPILNPKIDQGKTPILVRTIWDGEIIRISHENHNQWFLRCNKDQVTRM